jgi:hypothetical protein
MDKKDVKVLEKRETKLVSALARAIAIANGHSHPDDYADAVVNAFVDPSDLAEVRREEAAKREEEG